MKTMELDLWNEDFLVAGDWNVDIPVSHLGYPFGDSKADGCPGGNNPIGLQLQDAVEHVRSESPSRNEDILGLEWMESSDLCSYLEVLGSCHDKLLPLEASLIEYTSSIAPEEPVSFDEPLAKFEHTVKGHSQSCVEEYSFSVGSPDAKPPMLEHFLSAPSSPDQVAPIIKVEPVCVNKEEQDERLEVVFGVSFDFGNDALRTSDVDQSIVYDGLDLMSSIDASETVETYENAEELIGSPLSADDIESMLSGSNPTSPCSSSTNDNSSIIESSPELYKVISTSSIGDARFSPYSKAKSSKFSKVTSKSKASSEPVLDFMVIEQLSKKDRKKLQNKNAAIRYRMKKKEEAAGIKTEEQVLEEQNLELKTKVEDLQREIRYMKNLMEDVCRAKGLI